VRHQKKNEEASVANKMDLNCNPSYDNHKNEGQVLDIDERILDQLDRSDLQGHKYKNSTPSNPSNQPSSPIYSDQNMNGRYPEKFNGVNKFMISPGDTGRSSQPITSANSQNQKISKFDKDLADIAQRTQKNLTGPQRFSSGFNSPTPVYSPT